VTKRSKAGLEHHIATNDVVRLTATINTENDTSAYQLEGGDVGSKRANIPGAKWGR
jgi:hypothetical protein